MSTLVEAEKIIANLSKAEKAQVLQWLARDIGEAFPGIETNPKILGGEPCIIRTRLPIWLLVKAREEGATEAQLLSWYPSLRAEDLTNAWHYARAHTAEIELQMRANENA